jgi:hypothetical protein
MLFPIYSAATRESILLRTLLCKNVLAPGQFYVLHPCAAHLCTLLVVVVYSELNANTVHDSTFSIFLWHNLSQCSSLKFAR